MEPSVGCSPHVRPGRKLKLELVSHMYSCFFIDRPGGAFGWRMFVRRVPLGHVLDNPTFHLSALCYAMQRTQAMLFASPFTKSAKVTCRQLSVTCGNAVFFAGQGGPSLLAFRLYTSTSTK